MSTACTRSSSAMVKLRRSWGGCAVAFVFACNGGGATEGAAGSGESTSADASEDASESSSAGDVSSSSGGDENADGPAGGDHDGDGHTAASCGGDDCDDDDPDVHPAAPDVAGPPTWTVTTIDDENATTG